MATIDLGKIKQVWRGTYNNSTAYVVDDLVAYTDTVGGLQNTSTYIAVANTTGNTPASGGSIHASWNLVAQGVPDRIPSQSGQAGKFLKTDGSNVSFDSVTQIIKKIHSFSYTSRVSGSTNANHNQFTWTSSFTPLDPVNNLFHITGNMYCDSGGQDWSGFGLRFVKTGSGIAKDYPQRGCMYADVNPDNQSFQAYDFVFAGSELNGAGTYSIYHRTYASSSQVDYYHTNSSNNYRNPYQSYGYLTIVEYKNA